jgi:hypothetical protein
LVGLKPAGGAVGSRAGEGVDDDDGNAGLGADLLQPRIPLLRVETGEAPGGVERVREAVEVVGTAFDLVGLEFAGSQPGRERERVALDLLGLAECDARVRPLVGVSEPKEPQNRCDRNTRPVAARRAFSTPSSHLAHGDTDPSTGPSSEVITALSESGDGLEPNAALSARTTPVGRALWTTTSLAAQPADELRSESAGHRRGVGRCRRIRDLVGAS